MGEEVFIPGFTPSCRGGVGSPYFLGTVIRRGYTTGTTAAAACKAAILSLSGVVTSVPVHIPCGLVVSVPVFALAGNASCKKFAGDYPDDVTADCEFIAEATPLLEGIRFVPGEGIGRFSRDTPRFRKGEPVYQSRSAGMYTHLDTGSNGPEGTFRCPVKFQIPLGVEIAKKTLNSR